MKNLTFLALTIIMLSSALGLGQFVRPVEGSTTGMHLVKVNFYKAYVYDDHDNGPPGPSGPGEWYFYLRSPSSAWSGTGQLLRDGPGFSYFSLWQGWNVSYGASIWFQTRAREKDAVGWDPDAESLINWTLTWPTAISGAYYKRSMSLQVKDVIHYITYYIYNQAPVAGNIVREPSTYKDLSGQSSIYKGFPSTFVAENFFDKDGDSITYQWVVDGTQQSATSQSLIYKFTAGGSHTIKVRAKDSLSAYSAYVNKTITTVLYSTYARWNYGECTYYATLEFDKAGYDGVKAAGTGMDWGRIPAKQWIATAKANGWVTTTDRYAPKEGCLITWTGSLYGHVAVVLAVYEDGIKIGEMNWPYGSGITFSRLNFTNLDRDPFVFAGYIYPWKS